MSQNRGRELLHIIGDDVVAGFEQCGGARGLEECHARARARAQRKRRGLARPPHDRGDVAGDARLDAHRIHRLAQLLQPVCIDHRRDAVGIGAIGLEAIDVLRQDALLHVGRWVSDLDFRHEAIELGLGQWIRAFELDGVLRREDREGR